MALTKEIVEDKIEIFDQEAWKVVHIRMATKIKEDGELISQKEESRVIYPWDDWSSESDDIKVICNQVHTAERISAFKAAQEADSGAPE